MRRSELLEPLLQSIKPGNVNIVQDWRYSCIRLPGQHEPFYIEYISFADPDESAMNFFAALHEIGHAKIKMVPRHKRHVETIIWPSWTKDVLNEERRAWEWALANSPIEPDATVYAGIYESLTGYYNDRHRSVLMSKDSAFERLRRRCFREAKKGGYRGTYCR